MASPNTLALRQRLQENELAHYNPKLAEAVGVEPSAHPYKPLPLVTPGRDRSLRGKARRRAAREERQEARRINEEVERKHRIEALQAAAQKRSEASKKAAATRKARAAVKKSAKSPKGAK